VSPSQFGALPSASMPLAPSGKSVPSGSFSKLAPNPRLELEADEITAIEQQLSRAIGPMAKMIVRKEASRNASFKDFIAALAGNVDQAEQREQFLQGLRRALPRRH
jgi:hypothetical protein